DNRALVVEGAVLHGRFLKRPEVGFLRHAVDDASRASASKDQRARSLEDFNAVGIVEIPEDLTVIAHAVEEEVGGRGHLAANGDLVAVAFTLMDDDAGHVPGHVADALEALILDLLLCHDAHRLRDIAQWRIRLGRGAGPRRSVANVAS